MSINKECYYLTGMPTDVCNLYGITKTLLTRRETIRLKHLQKTLFVYRVFSENELDEKLKMMQFRGLMSYMEFLTNQLRGIYKVTRDFEYDDADRIVKAGRNSMIDLLKMYKTAEPIIILDFDRTITNQKFHPLYHWLCEEGFTIFINSANPDQNAILSYLHKWGLPVPQKIFANKGKQKKIVQLKEIAYRYVGHPKFYIDDEEEYLTYGNLLFYQCYQYTRRGQILSKTLFIK